VRTAWRLGALALAATCAAAPPVSADERSGGHVRVTTDRLDLVIALDGATPVGWRACHPSCPRADAGAGTSVRFVADSDPRMVRLVLHGPEPPVNLQHLRFVAEPGEDPRIVSLHADLPGGGPRLVTAFEVSREGYEVVMTVRMVGPDAAAFMSGRRLDLDLHAGGGLLPPPAAGFAAMLERLTSVTVAPGGVRVVDESGVPSPLGAGEWTGFRSRFWAALVRSDGPSVLLLRPGDQGTLGLLGEPGRLEWRYTFYSGPLLETALTRVDAPLGQLLFSGLWFWLRAMSFGLLFLLRKLTELLGHPGAAIIALAVSVKILLLPLTAVAGRLQAEVNATEARLQPGLDAIKAAYRGEERTRRTIALYRAEGVHPLYTMKSLLGVLIQLPVFVAVFDMLAEDVDLDRVPFLWIQDLSRPDALARLPACVPFFGCDLNLLPFLMSGVSLLTVLRFSASVLPPALLRRQRRNLMAVTGLFFLLFYTFPASMVLYWTGTNSVQLLGQELGRWWRHR
jgi:YidC/Oxa1 family membrane protein insertase